MEPIDFDWDTFFAESKALEERMRAVSAEMQRQNAISRASRSGGSSLVREQPPPFQTWDGRFDKIERMLAETLSAVSGVQREVGGLKADVSALKTDVAGLKTDVAVLKIDVAELKGDVAALKTDVAELKTDVAALKTDVAELKTDVAGLKTDVAALKTDVAELKTDVAALKTDVADIRERMATKVELESFRASVNMVADGFAETQARLVSVSGLLKRYLTA